MAYRGVAGSSRRVDCRVQPAETDEAPRADNVRVQLDQNHAHGSTSEGGNLAADRSIAARRSSVPGQDGIDAANERQEFGHVPAEKLSSRVIRDFAALVNKTRGELDVGFDRVHLR